MKAQPDPGNKGLTFTNGSARSSFFMFKSNFLKGHKVVSQTTSALVNGSIGTLNESGEGKRDNERKKE